MKNLVIVISGRGLNAEALIRHCQAGHIAARVCAVISNRAEVEGLVRARRLGVPTEVVDHTAYDSRESFEAQLAPVIELHRPDVLALAGFMRILTPGFVRRFEGRMVNVHPSLLPAFTGLKTHARAIAAGCKVAGATVHFVTPELDHGPIIAQAIVPVLPGDSEATLSARVLAREHVIYPRAVRWLVEDALAVEAGVVRQRRGEAQLLA